MYYVYIITNKFNTILYVAVTNDLIKRIFEHKSGFVDSFSKKYNLKKLVYYEIADHPEAAIFREKQLKNWHRQWKLNRINEFNPKWNDLCNEILK